MLDFEKEPEKQFTGENAAGEIREFDLLADEGMRLLAAIDKKQADISLQVEEIYDIVKESALYVEALRMERMRVNQLLGAVVGLADMIEDFCHFTAQSGNSELEKQALMMWRNAGNLLEGCAAARFGEAGQPLNPAIHSVHAAETSAYPREYIAKVLLSGYRYMGNIIRKASVIVSAGEDEGEDEMSMDNENLTMDNEV
ncbi:MAG: nucleotide exchange factor GrpE [Clostridiales bacterium]|nr:nucleotide exchange factor GrpE [Clostridiales bacterium]